MNLSSSPVSARDKLFCCNACALVNEIIEENHLEAFYSYRSSQIPPPTDQKGNFAYFDDPTFSQLNETTYPNGLRSVTLYLRGIYCAACIWLIEQLPVIAKGVISARVDLSKSSVKIIYDPNVILLSQIGEALNRIGYYPLAYNKDSAEQENERKTRDLLLRIGVAGFALGNIMLISFCLYQGIFSGIEKKFSHFFSWISLFLSSLSVFYSATPFYKASIGGLKARRIIIDLPISIGILVGYLYSIYSTVTGSGEIYFDSVSALIFFLLCARWLNLKALQHAQKESSPSKPFLPYYAQRITNGKKRSVYTQSLSSGDIIEIGKDSVVPADCRLLSEKGFFDCSIITGESYPVSKQKGDEILAGTKNVGGAILAEVLNVGDMTRISKILSSVSSSAPSINQHRGGISDKLSRYFTFILITAAVCVFLFWIDSSFNVAVRNSLALILVACPCAIGISFPLATARGAMAALKRGVFVRDPGVFERLSNTKKAY
ncbi:MAG: hypothetical protein D6808_01265, partial [Candidatus Dadabacteria bacterium]